ncbi:LamG domain-containing protein [Candidatus Poribacteria bacterium]
MKKIAGISALVCVTLLAGMMSLTRQGLAAIGTESLAGLWLFEEGNGETAADSSGNGHDGTLLGEPKWVKGKFGQALEFDGADDLVDTEYIADDQNGAWTVMCWAQLTGANPHGGYRLLAGRSNGTPQLWVHDTDNGLTMHKTENDFQQCLGKTIIPEEWTHLAGTFDGTNIKLYINGVEEESMKPAGDPIVNIYSVQIGGFDDKLHGGTWSGCWSNAVIDEVAIFSAALTENEIKSIMNNGIEATVLAVSPVGSFTDTWGRIKSDY